MNATKGFLFLMITLACKGEPVRSYCEALCDWAVSCTAEVRDIDVQAETDACLEATRGVDPSCAKAEDGTIDPASKAALEPCVNAIDENAASGQCDVFSGGGIEDSVGGPPAECATQADSALDTFNEARDTVAGTGEEVCVRMADALCQKLSDCILGDTEPPQAAIDALHGTPVDLCRQALDPAFTNDCVTNGLYEPANPRNPVREAALVCSTDVANAQCSDLLQAPPDLGEECAGSFSSPDQLLEIGQALIKISDDYAPYLEQM